jgi:hypothetical protein
VAPKPTFNNLYWISLEKFINEEDPSPECYYSKEVVPDADNQDTDLSAAVVPLFEPDQNSDVGEDDANGTDVTDPLMGIDCLFERG